MLDPKLLPGGGASEMALAKVSFYLVSWFLFGYLRISSRKWFISFPQALAEKSKTVSGVEQWPYRAVAKALEIIPKTLAENCGENSIRVLTALRAAHAGKFLRPANTASLPIVSMILK